MDFETLEQLKFHELSEKPNLDAMPLTRLENDPINISYISLDETSTDAIKQSSSFRGSIKLPPIIREAIDGTRPTLDFFKKLELGIVGETDKLLATTEGYVMANWEMDEIYGGKVTEKGALFQPKAFSDKIKVYRDSETGLLYVQEPSGHMEQLQKVDRWKREGYSYVYKNYFGHEVAIKWEYDSKRSDFAL